MSFRRRQPFADAAMARDHLLRLQARREHSAAELRRRLTDGGLSGDDADELIATLQRQGLQSDARYAELLLRSRRAQGYGPLRIEAELTQAGVSAADWQRALDDAEPDWNADLQAVRRRRFGDAETDFDTLNRQARHLIGRGFEPERVWRLLRARDAD